MQVGRCCSLQTVDHTSRVVPLNFIGDFSEEVVACSAIRFFDRHLMGVWQYSALACRRAPMPLQPPGAQAQDQERRARLALSAQPSHHLATRTADSKLLKLAQ